MDKVSMIVFQSVNILSVLSFIILSGIIEELILKIMIRLNTMIQQGAKGVNIMQDFCSGIKKDIVITD